MKESRPIGVDTLFILRRKPGGIGGAERVAERFEESFRHYWNTVRLAAGSSWNGVSIGGAGGPPWWRSWRYVRAVDRLGLKRPGNLVFSMEPGPECDVYRAGDGVHLRQVRRRYGCSPLWRLNPWHWLAPRMEYKGMRSARAVVANSRMVKKDIARAYPDIEPKVTVIHNGYDEKVFFPAECPKTELRKPLGLPEDALILLFSGSGFERKGLGEALAITAEAKRRFSAAGKPVLILVAGRGHAAPYGRRIRREGLADSVRFLGSVDAIADYYRAADCMVLPTLYDPFSNSTLEALACGCPVITTVHNGASELVHEGMTGYILGNLDPQADRAAAVSFLENLDCDPHQITRSVLSRRLESELREFIELFESLASTAPRERRRI